MSNYNTTRIYLWAGPGAGKSTLAADIFQAGKRLGKSVELVRERAKEIVWAGGKLDQLDLFAEQYKREQELLGKVDYIVTDSPFPLGYVYARHYGAAHWLQRALLEAAQFERTTHRFIDVFITATKPFVQAGRNEDELAARALDLPLRRFVTEQLPPSAQTIETTSDHRGIELWPLFLDGMR